MFGLGGSKAGAGPLAHDIRAGLPPLIPRLWRYGMVLSQRRDIADDLVQATCLRALEHADQFVPGSRLDHWLFAILRSTWINDLRKQRVRTGQGLVDPGEVSIVDERTDTERRVFANQVMAHVNALPEAQRDAVFLAYVEGFSYREVAQTLDIPIGTVMSRLANARAKLASLRAETHDAAAGGRRR